MSEQPINTLELRDHVAQLEAERALAHLNGLGEVATYMADLEEELDYRRRLYRRGRRDRDRHAACRALRPAVRMRGAR